MASTSKGSSAGGVCKHGFLIKSPPLQLFSSQNSWKRRFFILTKSSNGNYILKYLKGQNIKGSIAVDQITNIKVGISNSEIMEMVRKMFKCLPEQVMSIITGNRCYYLIGSSRQETEDWVTVISSVCREAKRGGCCPQDKSLGRSEENLLSSDTDEDIKKDEEEYYQTPRSILAKCTTEVSKPDHTAKSDVPVQEKPVQNLVNENIYMPMKSLRLLDESCQLTCRCDGLLSPPKQQDNDVCPRDLEANRDLTLPESSTSQQQAFQRRQSSLPLSVVQLSVLLSQVTDETQLQKLDIFIPLVDIESYLKLTEAAGQICVSQWAGPCRLGCLFNHGDHIMAVNDLKPQNVEEAYFFISRSTRKEVKLTVCRIPHSDTFHVIGCSCS
ncbi:pleckstrin homology domain-containing family S member 1 isoform X4 [Phalacrocorax aristotelis]|uniref:pleckstrin homology domain-containing family S member 1 isoform X4 n=1 Tax=Phalacrocorax aristotelis TaxID=126867 RepID=UPI003F4C4771